MAKSRDAFRTISEVAEWLGIQAHVLRFWESKFTQVKPIKRAGGRRYYRPVDMLLLGGIKKLLYEDGLTIKGVQKILREEGMSHVSEMSAPLDELTLSEMGGAPDAADIVTIEVPEAEPEPRGVVLSFDTASNEPEVKDAQQAAETTEEPEASSEGDPEAEEEAPREAEPSVQADATPPEPATADAPQTELAPEAELAPEPEPEPETTASLPSFLKRPLAVEDDTSDVEDLPEPTPTPVVEPLAEPAAAAAPTPEPVLPKPRNIPMPELTPEAQIEAAPNVLAAAYRAHALDAKTAADVAPLLTRLAEHRDAMSARRTSGGAPSARN